MDLFSKKINMQEAMHYYSILDNGGIDADVLMMHQALKHQTWNPTQADPYDKLKEKLGIPKTDVAKPQTDTTTPRSDIANPPTVASNSPAVSAKKNQSRQYIKLPNAIIQRHKHKYRKRKDERVNESTVSNED